MTPSAAPPFASFTLDIAGLGVVFFSPFAVRNIPEGTDYLEEHYTRPEDVAEQVNACTLTGFCTGSPGTYVISLFVAEPSEEIVHEAQVAIRLGLEVRDGRVEFRDLFDLMNWNRTTPSAQVVPFEDGFYRVTVLSELPPGGFYGDNQYIHMYFSRSPERPAIAWPGVPLLFNDA